MEWAQLVLSGGVMGSLGVLVGAATGRGERRAKAAATIEESASSAIKRLEGQVQSLDRKFDLVIERTSHLVRLVDIVAPIVESEHPTLAKDLQTAAVEVRKAL